MGLIKAATAAVKSTLHDQWKDYIKCEDLGNDILMKRVSTPNGIISKDSAIQVSPGQIAVIFQSGQILDATAEEGIYTFDQSSSPTFFAGQFGDVFKEMWTRFVYGGGTSKEQAVFYINAKEILDNKFGTPAPIPFQDWSHPIPNQMTGTMTPLRVEVKCFGKYTFKISDPATFMSKIAGTADEYRKDDIVEQMRSEVIGAFQKVLNELGNSVHKTPVLELPSAVQDAANNANGAANGFMGIGMMNMASGGMMGATAQGAFQNKGTTAADLNGGAAQQGAAPAGSKFCPDCGTPNNGSKFCPNCGKQLG